MMGELSVQARHADPWSVDELAATPRQRRHEQASIVPTVLGVVALFFAFSFIVLGVLWTFVLGNETPAQRATGDLSTRAAVWGFAWFASIGFSGLSTLVSLTVAISMKHRLGLVMSLMAGSLVLLTCCIGLAGIATAPSAPRSVPRSIR